MQKLKWLEDVEAFLDRFFLNRFQCIVARFSMLCQYIFTSHVSCKSLNGLAAVLFYAPLIGPDFITHTKINNSCILSWKNPKKSNRAVSNLTEQWRKKRGVFYLYCYKC